MQLLRRAKTSAHQGTALDGAALRNTRRNP